MKYLLILAGLAGLTLSTGCATVVKGNDQAISISTLGCKAESQGDIQCHIKNKDNDIRVKAPGTVNVKKSSNDLAINCESANGAAKGNTVVSSTYEAMNVGNVILGGGIGLIVDAASGAMWKFPAAVQIPMRCDPSVATANDLET